MKRYIKSSTEEPEYKLVVSPNFTHKPRWKQNGFDRTVFSFYSLDELISFMQIAGLLQDSSFDMRIENLMRKYDSEKTDGSIASTSWYDVYKGEPQMTEYTSY